MPQRLATLLIAIVLLTSSTSIAAQDDLMKKINQLEQQIKELKLQKEQQQVSSLKEEHCMKAIGRAKFCKCIAEKLPVAMSFEQYIHTIITPTDKLGYDSMPANFNITAEAAIEAREKCVEKGFFK